MTRTLSHGADPCARRQRSDQRRAPARRARNRRPAIRSARPMTIAGVIGRAQRHVVDHRARRVARAAAAIVLPSGAMIALVPTVEMFTTLRPVSIAAQPRDRELLHALVGVAEVGVVGRREDELGAPVDHLGAGARRRRCRSRSRRPALTPLMSKTFGRCPRSSRAAPGRSARARTGTRTRGRAGTRRTARGGSCRSAARRPCRPPRAAGC